MPIMQDRFAYRLCHDYLTFANDEPPFTACDAVAISQLAAGSPSLLKDYYMPAFLIIALRHSTATASTGVPRKLSSKRMCSPPCVCRLNNRVA